MESRNYNKNATFQYIDVVAGVMKDALNLSQESAGQAIANVTRDENKKVVDLVKVKKYLPYIHNLCFLA